MYFAESRIFAGEIECRASAKTMRECIMVEFLKWTAWPMVKPEAYGAFHLSFFFIGLAVSVLAAWLLRKSGSKTNRTILLSVGIFLMLTEVYKQLFYTFVIGDGQYQWWIFPFQLCSIPMYFCLVAPFLRDGIVRRGMYNFMLAFNLMSGAVAFTEPSGLVHEYWTLTLHAFTWHMILIFLGLYIGFSGRAGMELKDYRYAAGTFAVLCVIAFSLNMIFWNMPAAIDDPSGHMNMFYVGPANSPIIVFKDICLKFGWYVNTPIYIFCLCLAAFVFYFPFALYRKKHDKTEKQK